MSDIVNNDSTGDSVADYFFKNNPAPSSLAKHETLVREFVDYHLQTSPTRPIVLITSGGSSVPLEAQTVRTIENFSAGTRGSCSAEHFLAQGYAVIFLHRQFSLLPYSRHYSHSTNCFLDFMEESSDGEVAAKDEYQEKMKQVLRQYQMTKRERTLLLLNYTTVTEYLFELRSLAKLMQPLGDRAMFYLAAAVSDFFIPRDRMEEHKIQSRDINGGGGTAASGKQLVINLDPVPKFLTTLVSQWAPQGSMIVSFKLETDPDLLISKAEQALKRYGHSLVIGNLLTTRKWEVVFVSNEGERWIRVPRNKRTKSFSGIAELVGAAERKNGASEAIDLDGGSATVEIESILVPEVVKLHAKRTQR